MGPELTRILESAKPAPQPVVAAVRALPAPVLNEGGKDVPPAGARLPAQAPPAPEPADLTRMIEALNDFMSSSKRSLHFRYDESAGRTIITVVDPNSGEIVRQIPPEEMLALARSAVSGRALLFDQSA